jgi:hypothetical protein
MSWVSKWLDHALGKDTVAVITATFGPAVTAAWRNLEASLTAPKRQQIEAFEEAALAANPETAKLTHEQREACAEVFVATLVEMLKACS